MSAVTVNPELSIAWSDGLADLMGWNSGTSGDYRIETLAEGHDWGNPMSVRRELRSAMRNGSRSVKDRDDNRTVTLHLRVSGPGRSEGEGVLFQLDGKRCELTWRNPDPTEAAAVFIVVSATLAWEAGHDVEEVRGFRFYTLTLECLPYTHSADYVTIPAITYDVSTPVSVDDCTSLTGWTAEGATLSEVSGSIKATPTGDWYAVNRDAAIDLTGTPYLSVEYASGPTPYEVRAHVSGGWVAIDQVGVDGSAHIYDTSDLGVTAIDRLGFLYRGGGEAFAVAAMLDQISKQATPTSIESRSQLRSLTVPGSAPTQATLLVESATVGLGTAYIYSGPPYNPSFMRGGPGSTLAAPSNLSGRSAGIASGETWSFTLPASEFPEGDYSLQIRLRAATATVNAGTLDSTVRTRTATGVDITAQTLTSMDLEWPDTEYTSHLLGSVALPGALLPAGTSATVRLDLTWVGGTGVIVDDILAFNHTTGHLSIVEVGAYKRLWLESTTLDHPARALVGDDAYEDAVPLSLLNDLPSWPGEHYVESTVTYLYTGATGASDVVVSGTFRPAGFLHQVQR